MGRDPHSWWTCTYPVSRTTGTTSVGLDHLTFSSSAEQPRSRAASAKIRGWTLVTRNTADVVRSGVALPNPFEPTAR